MEAGARTVQAFWGAKIAVFLGADLVVILRDDVDHIPYPGHWDLPGGGREAGESPLGCALRETEEELGLRIDPGDVLYGRVYERADQQAGEASDSWFFAVHLPDAVVAEIRLGDEGQRWQLMSPQDYLRHDKAIPNFQKRLRDYLQDCHLP